MTLQQKIIKFITSLKTGWKYLTLCFLIGLSIFAAGHFQLSAWPQLNDFVKEVGKLIFVSGIAGAVFKIMATEGYFLQAVAEILYDEKGIEMLTAERRKTLWFNLLKAIYLSETEKHGSDKYDKHYLDNPHIQMKDSSDNDAKHYLDNLHRQMKDGIESQLPAGKDHFIHSSHRKILVTWANDERTILRLEDTTRSKYVSFSKTKPLVIEQHLWPASGVGLKSYITQNPNFVFKHNDTPNIQTISLPNGGEKTTIEVSARPVHEFTKTHDWRLPLLSDPFLEVKNPYLLSKLTLEISNKAEGLTIHFKPISDPAAFKFTIGSPELDPGKQFIIESQCLLFPSQGYLLFFQKK